MKIINKMALITSILLVFAGCKYEDFVTDFTFSSIYFPRQTNTRTFVVGENQSIEIGVVMGGKIGLDNPEQWAEYVIDSTLLVGKGLTLLPATYYKLSDSSKFIIPRGKVQGAITMTIDTAKFLNDPLASKAKYALPLRLKTSSLDSILPNKSTQIITLKFENQLFGNYYHNGVVEIATGTVIQTIYYHQDEPVTNAINNWILSTSGPYSLLTNGIINSKGGINILSLIVSKDNSVLLKNNPISPIVVSPNGACNYNPVKKEFYLQYKYTNAGKTYSAKDTLIFRNRILDGVNQW